MMVRKQLCSPLSLSLSFSLSLSLCQVRVQTIKEEKMSEYSYSRRFLISVVKSQGRSHESFVGGFLVSRISFFRLFCVCEVPRPPTGCRYLSLIVLGANKKSRCRCLHFIPHIHTPKKNGFFHCHGTNLRSFFTVNARDVSRTVRVRLCARALMFFFFFLSRVNLQPTWVLIPLTRVAKINRVSRNHREDRRRETDVQNNFFSSQQTTQLTQFSAVSSQFKNRTVAKVRAFRTI